MNIKAYKRYILIIFQMNLDGESGDEKTTWRRIETSGDHFGMTDSGFGHTASMDLFAGCFLYSSFKLYNI